MNFICPNWDIKDNLEFKYLICVSDHVGYNIRFQTSKILGGLAYLVKTYFNAETSLYELIALYYEAWTIKNCHKNWKINKIYILHINTVKLVKWNTEEVNKTWNSYIINIYYDL